MKLKEIPLIEIAAVVFGYFIIKGQGLFGAGKALDATASCPKGTTYKNGILEGGYLAGCQSGYTMNQLTMNCECKSAATAIAVIAPSPIIARPTVEQPPDRVVSIPEILNTPIPTPLDVFGGIFDFLKPAAPAPAAPAWVNLTPWNPNIFPDLTPAPAPSGYTGNMLTGNNSDAYGNRW